MTEKNKSALLEGLEVIENLPKTATVSGSPGLTGYAKLYDQYNDKLCSAISTLACLQITQNPITDSEYNRLKNLIESIRDILFSLKA